jgi:hypothetical protein
MTKQKKYEPQTVADAERVLADLEVKRAKLLEFGEKLTEARRTPMRRMRQMMPMLSASWKR